MSENDYVATAAAEKRLREVLTDRFLATTVEDIATALLDGAKIEYKARSRQVTISLTLPETGKVKTASKAMVEPEAGVTIAPEGTPVGGEPETTQAPPQPHIVAFTPQLNPDAEYEDVHFD